jgi:hypothetical protein
MKAKRYTEEQIIAVLREAEAGAKTKTSAVSMASRSQPFITGKQSTRA